MTAILTVDGLRLLHRYDTARKALAMWTEEKDKVRAELLEALGENTEGFFDGKRVVSITHTRPRRFNRADFALDHPQIYDRYLTEAEEEEVRLNVLDNLPLIPGSASRRFDKAEAAS